MSSEIVPKLPNIANPAGTPIVMEHMNLKALIEGEEIHKKLSDAIIEMITSFNLPYYGEFCQFINFWRAKIGTCGVNVTEKGMNFYWDPEWMAKRDRKETIFTIVHEVMHLLFEHIKRGVGYDKKIANYAQDMIINSIIHGDLMINEGLSHMISIPKDELGNNSVVFLPKEYTGSPIFEEVYAWLMKQYTQWQNENSDRIEQMKQSIHVDKNGKATFGQNCPQCGKDMNQKPQGGQGLPNYQGDGKQPEQGQGGGNDPGQQPGDQQGSGGGGQNQQPQDDSKCPHCGADKPQAKPNPKKSKGSGYGPNGKSGETGQNDVDCYPLDQHFENIEFNKGQSFDVHFDDDVPEEVRKQWVEATMEKLRSRGLETGDIEKVLNKLRKSEKDYLKEIKRTMSNDIFGNKKMKSITKPNRRGIWGLKGHRKYKTKINCLLDTSGSMGGDFERVLAYIFQNDIEINLIQCDTEVKNFISIKNKRELERMPIAGLGGTTLTPGLQYIAGDKELNKYATVVLTDGYTDTLNFTGLKNNVLIISIGTQCPTVPGSNSHSIKIKQILIDKTKQQ